VRSTTINAPGQERVKGNELGGGIPWVRPPDEWEKAVDHQSQEVRKGTVERLSGAKRPDFERQRRPTTSREKGTGLISPFFS
jgi:hypothetical protein